VKKLKSWPEPPGVNNAENNATVSVWQNWIFCLTPSFFQVMHRFSADRSNNPQSGDLAEKPRMGKFPGVPFLLSRKDWFSTTAARP